MPRESYYLPDRRLVSQEDQAMIARPNVPRSKFSGSWTRKTTFDAGYLVPFLVDEVLPGGHYKYDVMAYIRMFTPAFPMFDNQRIDTFFFFVPNRLVWTNWIYFMGQQESPSDSIAFTVPQVTSTGNGFAVGGIGDHLGLPTVGQPSAPISVNALPWRMYKLIYQQWFRDQNLTTTYAPSTGNGPDTEASYGALRRRAKSHDYFTSCLPWPQKFTAPSALGASAPIVGLGVLSPNAGAAGGLTVGVVAPSQPGGLFTPANQTTTALVATSGAGNTPLEVYADLSAVSVNTLRQSFLVQQLLEIDARGGTRYTEILKAHFGVTSPDARLQRSEYIGGGSTPLNVTPIANTSNTNTGVLGGAATAAGSHSASYAATEHGFVIGIINVRSELSYSQGTWKQWSRSTRYDYYWPSLAMLGEQAVLQKEIYTLGTAADDTVFGYQERWHEYRTRVSEVTGLFRPTAAGNIDEWHLSQQFNPAPTLGTTFIEDTPPMSRVLLGGAAATNQQYLADILIKREAVLPIPMFGTPASLGRF